MFENHLERLVYATVEKFTVDRIPAWIEKHTKINGKNYSFKDHEYQATILADTSREVVTRKCSQIGMSEASSRFALALTAVNPYYTVIYTLPSATVAANFMKTRIDPIVLGSEFLNGVRDRDLDNSEIKRFGDSYLYLKGCASTNAPISVPADHLIHDEVDFSSAEVISQYQSRLTHSPYKRKTLLSTPTFPNFGIDAEFRRSRRHFNLCRCNHCSHWFMPDYYENVQIRGFTGDLREINKRNIHKINWREAVLLCPSCGKVPDLGIENREYVCENPNDNYVAAGYQISPFDAPNIHLRNAENPLSVAAFLVETSTKYEKLTDFVNFNLGLPAEDSDSTVTIDDVRRMIHSSEEPKGGDGTYVFGLDMGLNCHITVGKVLPDGHLDIVLAMPIRYTQIKEERRTLAQRFWPRLSVADNLPYTETINAMQKEDPNLYGAWNVPFRSMELFKVTDREEDSDKTAEELRQVHVNKNKALDALLADIRAGHVTKRSCPQDEEWVKQLTDMKRGKEFTKDQQIEYVWKKSPDGNDHYHHSLLYCYIAARMVRLTASGVAIRPRIRKFRRRN